MQNVLKETWKHLLNFYYRSYSTLYIFLGESLLNSINMFRAMGWTNNIQFLNQIKFPLNHLADKTNLLRQTFFFQIIPPLLKNFFYFFAIFRKTILHFSSICFTPECEHPAITTIPLSTLMNKDCSTNLLLPSQDNRPEDIILSVI